MHELEIPLSSFQLQLGTFFCEGEKALRFTGNAKGFAVFGPYLPIKAGLYTFTINVSFPTTMMPRAFIDVCGDGVVLALQHISTPCKRIRIPVYVNADCRLEVRLHTWWTPCDIKRVAYSSGIGPSAADSCRPPRKEFYRLLERLLGPDGEPPSLPNWSNRDVVAEALFADNHFHAMPVQSIHEHDSLLRQAGILPATVQAFFHENNAASPIPAAGDLVDGYPDVTNGFQQQIVESGCLEMLCPYDGSSIRTQNSIPVSIDAGVISIVYEFISEQRPIVVGVSNGWAGTIAFLWLASDDILIYDDVAQSSWYNPLDIISEYLLLCVQHADLIGAYRKADHKPAVATGFICNMGHYFWNDTSGLERLIRLTGLQRVQTIYSRRGSWLATREIFGCEGLPPIVELDGHQDLFREVLSRREILVRPTGSRCDDALAQKVRRAAEIRFVATAPERCRMARALTAHGEYVLYVNLRSHNKAWVQQEKGVVGMIRSLRALRHNDIVVYLDGYLDCAEVARSIASTPIDRVAYVDGTAADFSETLYWAFRCDFFVAVIGSGLVPVTWLANKPGVCYSDSRHLAQMSWWPRVRRDMAPVRWPSPDQVRNLEEHMYANYNMKPEIMIKLFRDVQGQTGNADRASSRSR